MRRFRGVVLDVDGTLVDSNDGHARSWVEALAEQGITVPLDEVRKLIGMGGDKLLTKLTGLEEESAKGKKVSKRHREIFKRRYLSSLHAFPRTRELLRRMRAAGLRLTVASSAKEDELKPLLHLCGADEVIESKTSSDDAEHSKPDPDIVQAALNDLGLPRSEVVMIGDTPYDVEAARKAGIAIIAVRCGGWGDKDLAGAVVIYNDPADLLTHFDTSPLAAPDCIPSEQTVP